MIYEGLHPDKEKEEVSHILSMHDLALQGIATSIDALSVGFTIANYEFPEALGASLIIGGVTYVICLAGLLIGRRAGTALSDKASIFGGVILILIGFKIFFGI
jgi:putative Mn2+ efflux pump MntP